MKTKVFVDGQEGTTGLRINEYLAKRSDIEMLRIDADRRKDIETRRALLNEADVAFLCLPDAAAKESAALAGKNTLSSRPEHICCRSQAATRTDGALNMWTRWQLWSAKFFCFNGRSGASLRGCTVLATTAYGKPRSCAVQQQLGCVGTNHGFDEPRKKSLEPHWPCSNISWKGCSSTSNATNQYGDTFATGPA